jgi:hypothetical protein
VPRHRRRTQDSGVITPVQNAFPNVIHIRQGGRSLPSVYAMPFVDAVANISSKTALWTLFWDKRLLGIGGTFSAISDWRSAEEMDVADGRTTPNKDSLLHFLLSRYYVPQEYFTDGAWLASFLRCSIAAWQRRGVDAEFFEPIDGELGVLEKMIGYQRS